MESSKQQLIFVTFFIWWATNNCFAIDTDLFFHKFRSPWFAVDLTFVQIVLGVAFLRISKIYFHRNHNEDNNLISNGGDNNESENRNLVKSNSGLYALIGFLHATGSFLTIISYSSLGAVVTLMWKLTESFSAVLLRGCLIGAVPLQDVLAVGMVLSGVISFSVYSFQVLSYVPIIASNIIFPLRNVLIKLADNRTDSSEEKYSLMLHYGLPLTSLCMLIRVSQESFILQAVPYLIRNAFLFNMYQFSSIYLLSMVDSISHSLLNTFKRFTGIVFATLVFKKEVRMEHFIGIIFSFLGFSFYAFFRKTIDSKLSNRMLPIVRNNAAFILIVQIGTPLLLLNKYSQNQVKSDVFHVRHGPLVNHCLNNSQLVHVIVDFREFHTPLTEPENVLPWSSISTHKSDHILKCNSFDDCKTIVSSLNGLFEYKPVVHLIRDHCAEDNVRLQQTTRLFYHILNEVDIYQLIVYGINLCFSADNVLAKRRTALPPTVRMTAKEACPHCHRGFILVHGKKTASHLKFIFPNIYVFTHFGIWGIEDAYLGRTLNSRYKTISNAVSLKFMNITILTSSVTPYVNQHMFSFATMMHRNKMRVSYVSSNPGLRDHQLITQSESGELPVYSNITSGLLNEFLNDVDIVITPWIEGAILSLRKGVAAVFAVVNGTNLDIARQLMIPYIDIEEMIHNETRISEVKGHLSFNKLEFDLNRCENAKRLIKFYSRLDICLTQIINIVATAC